ncbi:MAG TPA: hypothetical protein VF017_17710 [Thermoanaerobaculia bacterium]|nr:hypothetical protein [Thermoanaerobaculia bacterium]
MRRVRVALLLALLVSALSAPSALARPGREPVQNPSVDLVLRFLWERIEAFLPWGAADDGGEALLEKTGPAMDPNGGNAPNGSGPGSGQG